METKGGAVTIGQFSASGAAIRNWSLRPGPRPWTVAVGRRPEPLTGGGDRIRIRGGFGKPAAGTDVQTSEHQNTSNRGVRERPAASEIARNPNALPKAGV